MLILGVSIVFIGNSSSHTSNLAYPKSGDIYAAPIYIDDLDPNHNWDTFLSERPWISGSGEAGNPYKIHSFRIDAQGGSYCISVKNSNKFFYIEECTLFNTGQAEFGTGICFDNVTWGFIVNSDIYNNGFSGILATNSSFIAFSNTIHGNEGYGISLGGCQATILHRNTIQYHSGAGIELYKCSGIIVAENELSYNGYYGVICDYTNESEILDNSISSHNDGVTLAESNNNLIDGNSISHNDESGIMLAYNSNFNSITNNRLNDNQYCILIGESCQGTQLSNNGDCQVYSFDDSLPSSDDPGGDDNNDLDDECRKRNVCK